jgi:two-component system, chemotaxis family, CheB/CheR fusion protein
VHTTDGRASRSLRTRAKMDTSIIAVASYGDDLEAVSELLSALPVECGATFVVAQYLNSGRERLPEEALAKGTILPVMRAHDGVVTEQEHVYLIPASSTPTMTGRRIRVTPNASKDHHPGDILFTSLAEERGDRAIGVVLSGGGSDGALGVQAIKQRGGTTFAQYPGSARFPSMPISAIETGCVGFVLRPNEIARELTRLSRRDAVPLAGVARRVLVIDDKAGLRRGGGAAGAFLGPVRSPSA